MDQLSEQAIGKLDSAGVVTIVGRLALRAEQHLTKSTAGHLTVHELPSEGNAFRTHTELLTLGHFIILLEVLLMAVNCLLAGLKVLVRG